MSQKVTKPPPASERQLRLAIPPSIWDDLVAYKERNAHDSLPSAARELIRQALVRERQEQDRHARRPGAAR